MIYRVRCTTEQARDAALNEGAVVLSRRDRQVLRRRETWLFLFNSPQIREGYWQVLGIPPHRLVVKKGA